MDLKKIYRNFRDLAFAAVLAGTASCAGSFVALPFAPPKDVPQSILREQTVYAPAKPAKVQPLLAVVRFPGRIEDRAEPVMARAYSEQYLNAPKGYQGFSSRGAIDPFDNKGGHQQMLVRSTYFAAEMYEQLTKRLPPKSVALQPMSIDLDEHGFLALRSPNKLPPAVLYIDFFAYYAPKRAFIALPESFGKYLSSVVSVHTSVDGAPDTFGAIAGMKQVPLRGGQRHLTADGNGLRGNLVTFLNDWLAEQCSRAEKSEKGSDEVLLPRCAGAEGRITETVGNEKIIRERPFKPGYYFELPLVEYAMDLEELTVQSKIPGGNLSEPPARKVFGAYADVIVEALNVIDHEKAIAADRRLYAAIFDPDLASTKEEAVSISERAAKMAVIEKFEGAEREFLSHSDRKFIDTTYKSTFGDELRKTLLSEEEVHSKLVQGLTMEFVAGMMQAGLAFGGGALGSSAASMAQLVNQLTTMMLERSAMLKEQGSAFDKHFKRVNDDVIQFTMEQVGGKVAQIQTTGLADLRTKMQALYRQIVNGKLDDDPKPARPLNMAQQNSAPAENMVVKSAPKPTSRKK